MARTNAERGRGGAGAAGGRSRWSARSSRDAAEQRRLVRAARRGDRSARERLAVEHLDVVGRIAARYRNLGLAYDDLVQEGSIGLLDAIDGYDEQREADFEAFARFRVKRAIRNALTDKARLVRLPKHVVERRRAIANAEARLLASGHAAAPSDVADAIGLSHDVVVAAQTASITPLSLDDFASEDGSPLEALVGDDTATNPTREAETAERTRLVREAIARLGPRQRRVVIKRFGLDGVDTPVAELAEQLGLSERRTRTIEQDALRELAGELSSALEQPGFGTVESLPRVRPELVLL